MSPKRKSGYVLYPEQAVGSTGSSAGGRLHGRVACCALAARREGLGACVPVGCAALPVRARLGGPQLCPEGHMPQH